MDAHVLTPSITIPPQQNGERPRFLFVIGQFANQTRKHFRLPFSSGDHVSQNVVLNEARVRLTGIFSDHMAGYIPGTLRLIMALDSGISPLPHPLLDGSERIIITNLEEFLH